MATRSGGAHEHSYAYGELAEKVLGSRPFRMMARVDDEPMACIQGVGSARIPGGTIKIGGMSGGPVLAGSTQESIAGELMRGFEAQLRRRMVGRIVIHQWRDSPMSRVLEELGYRVDRSVGVFEIVAVAAVVPDHSMRRSCDQALFWG